MAYIKNTNQAISYCKFRPSPPEDLIQKVVKFVKEEINGPLGVALDVGCGSGQSTEILSPHFQHVVGIDNSKEQLKHAQASMNRHKNIVYRNGSAENLEEADGSVHLVTVGMAVHWFDLHRFSAEVGRVLCPNGVLAIYGYNLPRPAVDGVCLADSFYGMIKNTLGQYFPEESKLAYFEGYNRDKFSKFPFSRHDAVRTEFPYKRKACLKDLIGYITTMSGFQNFMKSHGEENAQRLLTTFKTRIAEHQNKSGKAVEFIDELDIEITFPYFLLLSRKNKL